MLFLQELESVLVKDKNYTKKNNVVIKAQVVLYIDYKVRVEHLHSYGVYTKGQERDV